MISSNTSLRSLTFDPILLMQRLSRLYAWIPILLSQVTSGNVQEISFVLVWNNLDVLESLDLECIQEVLCTSVFERLERVVFRLIGNVDSVVGSREIWKRMGRLAGRELLVFCKEGCKTPIRF